MRDSVFPQVAAYVSRAVSLVAQEMFGPSTRSSRSRAPDFDPREYLLELGAIVDVATRDEEAERASAAVAGEVDFRGQSATGSSEGVRVCRFRWGRPFLRAPAACW